MAAVTSMNITVVSNTAEGSSGGATATFSGSWLGTTFFHVQGFQGPNDLWVFAVHHHGHTKMVGIRKSANQNNYQRVDGRYTPKGVLTKMSTDSIIAAWGATSNRGVTHGQYTLTDLKFS